MIKYWPIITAVLATTAGFGMSFQKIENLEQAVMVQAEQSQKIEDMKAEQSALTARQEMMIDMLKEIKQDIKDAQNP